MKFDTVKALLGCLGVNTKALRPTASGWVSSPCPLAPWTHDSGKDSHPSFAVKVSSGKSPYNCFSCGGGDVEDLVIKMGELGAEPPHYHIAKALEILAKDTEDGIVLDIDDYGVHSSVQEDVVIPPGWLMSFLPAKFIVEAYEYLLSRGLNFAMLDEFDIRFDTKRKAVCFPIRNFEGEVVAFRGRHIRPDAPYAYHAYTDWPGYTSSLVWYGEDTIDMSKTVVMVESLFDYTAVWPLYKNILAPLSVGMSKEKLRRVADCYDIVTFFDTGKGGDRARSLIDRHFPASVIQHVIPGQGYSDPGDYAKGGPIGTANMANILHHYLPKSASVV